MPYKFTNYGSTTLAQNVNTVDTTIVVTAGGVFPTISTGETFMVVLERADGVFEICKCTAREDNDLTVVRAQEQTSTQTFTAGDRVELRLTSGVLNSFVQGDSASFTGDLDMNGYAILDATFNDVDVTGGILKGVTLRGSDGGTANELVVPDAGAAPTIGGNTIWHSGNDGTGSELDAGKLGGQVPYWFRERVNHVGTQAASTITGLAASATTDTTNANNISAGTLSVDRLSRKALRWTTNWDGTSFSDTVGGRVHLRTTAPSASDGENGDLFLVIEP